ncbi:MAG: AAA family ATPase [Methanothrix sp.]|jgi:thymidylate kinase
MAFKVIIDGKPCSGKSTIAGEVEKLLREKGTSAIDAKSYAMEKGFLSGFLKKFALGEIESYRSFLYTATYHVLSYAAQEASAWKNSKKYEVVLMQKSPYSFSFMMDAARNVSGKEPKHEKFSLLTGVIKAWAGTVRPDLFIYLTADLETLRERFKHRSEGRDRVHAQMIEEDDSSHLKLFRGYTRNNLSVIKNNSSVKDGAASVTAAIIEAYSASKLQGAKAAELARSESADKQ